MKACPTCQQPAPDTDVCRHCWSTLEAVDETTFGPMFTTRLVAYEPAPKPAQGSFSLRKVEFEPAPWWRREGIPLLKQSLLVVLLIGLGLGGYWYYQNHQRQQQAEFLATHLSQAASFEKQEDLKKAEQQLNQAVALSTHQAVRRQALLSRADFYYRHQRWDSCCQDFKAAGKLSILGAAEQKAYAQARKRLAKANRVQAVELFHQAQKSRTDKDYQVSLQRASQSLELFTDNHGSRDQIAECHALLGTVYHDMRSDRLAQDHLMLALQSNGRNPAVRRLETLLNKKQERPADYQLTYPGRTKPPPPTRVIQPSSSYPSARRPEPYQPSYVPMPSYQPPPVRYQPTPPRSWQSPPRPQVPQPPRPNIPQPPRPGPPVPGPG